MSWNGSPMTMIKGVCKSCEQPFERKVSIHSARQLKDPHCGKLVCRRRLATRRHQEKRDKAKL